MSQRNQNREISLIVVFPDKSGIQYRFVKGGALKGTVQSKWLPQVQLAVERRTKIGRKRHIRVEERVHPGGVQFLIRFPKFARAFPNLAQADMTLDWQGSLDQPIRDRYEHLEQYLQQLWKEVWDAGGNNSRSVYNWLSVPVLVISFIQPA